jgi:dipeptidyl aminopeptidase/acylaminoacyl peptidase
MAKTTHLRALAATAGVLAAVGMLMLMILVVDEPARAAFPGENGKIVFWSSRDGNAEIYTMNPNGQGIDRLTNDPKEDLLPAWSPSGGKIAFVSNRDGNREIYTMNANGQGVDRLTNDPKEDFLPAWSPSGGKIAFESNRDGNNPEIYTMNPNGQGVDNLTNNPASDSKPSWSPDGNKIAFQSGRGNDTDIYTMNANGQGVDNLTKHLGLDEWPAWSPDGKKIAFTSERSGDSLIYTLNANGQGLDTLTNQNAASPDWQPLSPAKPTPPPNPKPPNNNTKAPKVISTSPKANAKGVAPTASLKATFSEKMRASSVNATTFELFEKKKGSTNKKLPARVSYNAATKKATLDPTTSLRRGVAYKAVVSTGAKDAAGNRLDQKPATKGPQPKAWSFTVRR